VQTLLAGAFGEGRILRLVGIVLGGGEGAALLVAVEAARLGLLPGLRRRSLLTVWIYFLDIFLVLRIAALLLVIM